MPGKERVMTKVRLCHMAALVGFSLGVLFVGSFAYAGGIQGFNSETVDLPIGAGSQNFLLLTSTGSQSTFGQGYVLFGTNDHNPNAWINTNTGEVNIAGSSSFFGPSVLLNGIKVSSGSSTVARYIYDIPAGDGNSGILVGPNQFFGVPSNGTYIGFWNNGGSVVLNNTGVGVGVLPSRAQLEVSGNARISGELTAASLIIGGTNAGQALDVSKMNNILSLSDLLCPEGQALTKDTDTSFACVPLVYNGSFSCGAGQALVGFLNGAPQCAAPTSACRPTVDCTTANLNPGDMCNDYSVYAGKTPDGNKKMFMTPCDSGMTWDGCSQCVGNRWFSEWSRLTSATGVNDMKTGQANTIALATGQYMNSNILDVNAEPAKYCYRLVAFGHDDWYLPAANELYRACLNKIAIGHWGEFHDQDDGDYYWSSTEGAGGGRPKTDAYNQPAWSDNNVCFNPPVEGCIQPKFYSHPVRCVRKGP
jgi:hypothetical protein